MPEDFPQVGCTTDDGVDVNHELMRSKNRALPNPDSKISSMSSIVIYNYVVLIVQHPNEKRNSGEFLSEYL